mmetsp:Transcript_25395/g.54521  ORF Transcript_25395/g.54521 Transcript_25395/m.54521 type:complete len:744 (-) Transcript_25395:305-2536(-)
MRKWRSVLLGACLLSALLSLQLASCVLENGTAKEGSLQYEVWSSPTLFARRGSRNPGGGSRNPGGSEIFAKEPISFSFEDGLPLCQNVVDGVPLNIFVMMSSWNNKRLLSEAISSVTRQNLPNFPYRVQVTLVVFEDQSDDMLSEVEKDRLTARMDIHFLSAPGSHLGSAGSKWVLLQHLRKIAGPNDYVVMLDGDQGVFSDSNVLADISQKVIPNQPWFAWGKMNLPMSLPKSFYQVECKDVPRFDSPDSAPGQKYDFRREPFVYCHPRIFSAHLIGVMEESDFQRDGSFLQNAVADCPMIYKMLETAGVDRVRFVDERPPMYNYSFTGMNGLSVFSSEVIEGGDKHYVDNLPSVSKERQVVHVVSAVFDRPIENWLDCLVASYSPDGVDFQFHIGVNDVARLEELQILAKKMSRPGRTVLLHPMAENYRGISRFLVAKKLRLEVKLDFVIFLDDDISVQEKTLQTVWERRAALTYKCVYGKHWNVKSTQEYSVDYWRPDSMCFLRKGEGNERCGNKQLNSSVVEWQYGGTGLSIIDASIFDDPLVFKIPREYLHVEDLWISYLVLLKGWRIPRLFDVKYDFMEELSLKGQWQSLKAKKETMLKRLATCPTSIFEAFHCRRNLWSTAPQGNRQVTYQYAQTSAEVEDACIARTDGRDGHFLYWAKKAYFPVQPFWYFLCALGLLATALIHPATRLRRRRPFRRHGAAARRREGQSSGTPRPRRAAVPYLPFTASSRTTRART